MAEISEAEVDRMYSQGQAWQLYDFLDEKTMQDFGLPPLTEDSWEAFTEVFEHKWFKRAWILQEVALAKDAAIIWDNTLIPWRSIASCSELLTTSNLSRGLAELRLRKNPTNSHITQVGTSSEAVNLIQQLCRGRAADLDEEYVSCLERIAGFSDETKATAHYLLLLLLVSREFQATDGRDKIFALMGVMNHLSGIERLEPLDIKPTYGEHSTTAMAFVQAATSIITDCNHIGILTLVPDVSVVKVPELPSWVPDFTVQGPNPILTLIRSTEMASFDASGPTSRIDGRLHFRISRNELHLKAFQIGSVVETSEACLDYTNKGHFDKAAGLLLKCDPVYKATNQSRIEAFWRTLILDMDDFHSPASPELGASFKSWISYLLLKGVRLTQEDSDTEPQQYINTLRNIQALSLSDSSGLIPSAEFLLSGSRKLGFIALEDSTSEEEGETLTNELQTGLQAYQSVAFTSLPYRRLFLTESGYMGLGLQSLQVGDGIFIIAGCPSPLVLRNRSPVSSSGGFMRSAWVLVSQWAKILKTIVHRMFSLLGVCAAQSDFSLESGALYKPCRLIGEAYVHGAMHGETVSKDAKWEHVCLE